MDYCLQPDADDPFYFQLDYVLGELEVELLGQVGSINFVDLIVLFDADGPVFELTVSALVLRRFAARASRVNGPLASVSAPIEGLWVL